MLMVGSSHSGHDIFFKTELCRIGVYVTMAPLFAWEVDIKCLYSLGGFLRKATELHSLFVVDESS